MEVEVSKEVKELGTMTLLDHIALLDCLHWTPPVYAKCGEQQPGHGEMECPQYEYCGWCRQHGSCGFINRHKCQILEEGEEVVSTGWDDCDHNLWHNTSNL